MTMTKPKIMTTTNLADFTADELAALALRFWPKVDTTGGPDACWEWKAEARKGYGMIRAHRRNHRAHRVALALDGRMPAPKDVVRHKCDNPGCVNPAHLETGTHADNMRDKVERGRGARGERNGRAVLTSEDVGQARERVRGGESIRSVARDMKVSHVAMSHAVHGHHWTHHPIPPVTARGGVLTSEDVGQARERVRAGESIKAVAQDMQGSYAAVRSAVRGDTWPHHPVTPVPAPTR